jgi:predicted Fe-S protein YdhL (DUF1289 family)
MGNDTGMEISNWGSLDTRQKTDLLNNCLSHKYHEYPLDRYMRGKTLNPLNQLKKRIDILQSEMRAERAET